MFTNIARHGPSLLFDFVRPYPCICLDVVQPCPCASTTIDPALSCASTSSHPARLCASTPPVAARPCALPSTRPGVSLTTRQLQETGDFWQHGQRVSMALQRRAVDEMFCSWWNSSPICRQEQLFGHGFG